MPTKKKNKLSKAWEPTRDDLLIDPEVAASYIQDAEEEGTHVIQALRHVAEAHGISKVAQRAGIGRETLYKMLSESGNPSLENFNKIILALGLKTLIVPATVNE